MNILLISTWFPFPIDNGSRIRINYLLHSLVSQHNIHLITFLPSENELCFLPELESLCYRVEVVKRNPFWHNPSKKLTGYISTRPRDIAASYSNKMAQLVCEANSQQNFDVVIASVINVAEYALQIRDTPCMIEEHNFMTAWMHENYQTQRNPFKKLTRWLTWRKCLHYERWLYPHFTGVSMVSERDRQALLTAIPSYQGQVEVIPNGVDLHYNQPGMIKPQSDTLVYNGALTYSANLDAMHYFLNEIYPQIRLYRPEVSLLITGCTDSVDLHGLPLVENVCLTGYLEDVRSAVAGSWACVVPLRAGAGTRLKILEAMALGTPVVSTSKGAEGLDVTHEKTILLADDPADFARQTIRLLKDSDLRSRLSINGRKLVEQKYGWQEIGKKFVQLVEDVAHT